MRIIKDENFNKVTAEEGKHIRSINDVYEPEYEENGILIPEHYPYYSELLYLPPSMTEEQIFELYVEEDKEA